MNKDFWRASIIRAIRTICQTAVATIGTAMVVAEVDWRYVLSASALAGLLSMLTSIATGLPEVDICHELTEEEAADFIDANDEILDDLYEYETEENEYEYEYDEEGEI